MLLIQDVLKRLHVIERLNFQSAQFLNDDPLVVSNGLELYDSINEFFIALIGFPFIPITCDISISIWHSHWHSHMRSSKFPCNVHGSTRSFLALTMLTRVMIILHNVYGALRVTVPGDPLVLISVHLIISEICRALTLHPSVIMKFSPVQNHLLFYLY